MSKFSLGQLAMTPGAQSTFSAEFLMACLKRHANGDWGNVVPGDAAANDASISGGAQDQLLSVYEMGEKKLWIVTEWDRSVTTMLLPSEY